MKKYIHFLGVIVVSSALFPSFANAVSFAKLATQNYTVGKLSKGKSGTYGWVVSNGSDRYFCRFRGGVAYVGEKGMVSVSTSGRLIKLDRATYETTIGHDPSIPQWSDLQIGHVKPSDVGDCTPLR